MQEEIFGPILPVLTYVKIDEVVKQIDEGDKPLAMYYFGNKNTQNCKTLRYKTSSGSFVINDCLI